MGMSIELLPSGQLVPGWNSRKSGSHLEGRPAGVDVAWGRQRGAPLRGCNTGRARSPGGSARSRAVAGAHSV